MTEYNSAITGGITIVNESLDLVSDSYSNISLKITTINDSLELTQTALVVPSLGYQATKDIMSSTINELGDLSDMIIQRGKDLLLLADQANQFICVSNDSFDRVVDNYNWITTRDIYIGIIESIPIVISTIQALDIYIDTRVLLITDPELLETQTYLSSEINNIQTLLDNVSTKILDVKTICKKTTDIIQIYRNVLDVNATVGIALSVTTRAWQTFKRINQFNYKTVDTPLDQVIAIETSNSIVTNPLYPKSMIEREKTIHAWLTKFLVSPKGSTSITMDNKIYKFINKKNLESTPFSLPDGYSIVTGPQLLDNYLSTVPDRLAPVLEEIIVARELMLDTTSLETWYNLQDQPDYTLADLIAVTLEQTLIDLLSKYKDASVINEFIDNHKIKQRYLEMQDALKFHNIHAPIFTEIGIINDTLYQLEDSTCIGFPSEVAFQQYINDSILSIKSAPGFASKVGAIYSQVLNYTSHSGTLTLAKYSVTGLGEEVLEEIIDEFKYKYSVYQDDFKIHYLEASINNKDFFLINGTQMQFLYKYKEDLPNSLEFIDNTNHTNNLTYNYISYLNTYEFFPATYDLAIMDVKVDTVVEDKLNGLKQNITSTYTNSLNVDSLPVITKTTDQLDSVTHWVTDKPLERIATDITNIYREELLAGRMDFSQARINSIVSTIRFLQYRERLDEYINDTWTYGVARYRPQM